MTELKILKQKKAGIILIIFGAFLLLFVVVFLYSKIGGGTSFSEILPANETAAYFELPATGEFPSEIKNFLGSKEKFIIDMKQNIAPISPEDSKFALAFLVDEGAARETVPLLLFQINSAQKALDFLKTYSNTGGNISKLTNAEFSARGATPYATPSLSFAFIGDSLIIGESKKNLLTFFSSSFSSPLTKHLDNDENFIRIRQNLNAKYFIYLKPNLLAPEAISLIAERVPRLPLITLSLPAIGISADKTNEKTWIGSSYLSSTTLAPIHQEQPYKALLLPFLPPDPNILLAGQNIFSQLEKIATITNADGTLPKIKTLIDLTTKNYFPELTFENDIAPLLKTEFAITINGPKILFITELKDKSLEQKISKLENAFTKIAGNFTPKKDNITLPDGTPAQELSANPEEIKKFQENFNKIAIKGLILGKENGQIYYAIAQEKWFLSNDLNTLRKSLLLTQEPGQNLRETDLYKNSLRPILKNPELLGTAGMVDGTFSFSKRTFTDHMETQFMFRNR